MFMQITDAAAAKLKKYLDPEKKVLLSLDDGVGPFSNAATCSLEIAFNLLIVDADLETPDYQDEVDTDLGQFGVKDYSKEHLGDNLKLDLNERMNTLILSGPAGVIDGNVQINDLSGYTATHDKHVKVQSTTHDC